MQGIFRYIAISVILILPAALFCQTTDGGYSQAIDKMTPAAPQATLMQRFGNYPVDYATGVTNIDIPLFEISIGDFSFPISISYHASGIKVQDIATPVGLGWMLNAGGAISRQGKGKTDYGFIKYRSEHEIDSVIMSGTIMSRHWDLMTSGMLYDTEPDRYSYSFLGYSGVFRHGVYDNAIYSFPYTDMKITDYNDGYCIIDSRGTSYYFTVLEKFEDYTEGGGDKTSTWYLSKVLLPNRQDSIMLEYENGNILNERSRHDYVEYVDYVSYHPGTDYYYNANTIHSTLDHSATSTVQMRTKHLSKIRWNGNVISFSYQTDRQDYRWYNQSQHRLSKISVINQDGNAIRSIDLYNNSTYGTSSGNYRMFLDSIVINGTYLSQTDREVYSFDYNSPSSLPDYTGADINCHEDYWGYYNGSNTDGWTPEEFAISGARHANRTPDNSGNKTKYGMLERIHYPSGGYTEYSYEPNRIANGMVWGGLRIQSVKDFDANGVLLMQKTYGYSLGIEAIGITRSLYRYNTWCRYLYTNDNSSTYVWTEYHDVATSTPAIPLTGDYGSPLYYKTVIEYDGTPYSYSCKTVYSFEDSRVLDIDTFEDQNDHSDEIVQYYNTFYNLEQGNIKPLLSYKKIYDSNDSLVYSESIDYNEEVLDTVQLGVHVKNRWVVISLDGIETNMELSATRFREWYAYYDVLGFPTIKLPYSKTVSCDGKSVTTYYTYDSRYRTLTPIAESVCQTGGDCYRTEYAYPFDFPDSAVCVNMTDANLLVPINVQKKKNGICMSETKTHYSLFNNLAYLPEWVALGIGGSSPEKRISYDYDDKGHLLYAQKDDAIHNLFIWGNTGECPIGHIAGLSRTRIQEVIGESSFHTLKASNNPVSSAMILQTRRNALSTAGGLVSRYSYTPLIGVSSIYNPTGLNSSFEYDGMGRLSSVSRAGEITDRYSFYYQSLNTSHNYTRHETMNNAAGNVGVTEVQYYDGLGRPTVAVSNANGNGTNFMYQLQEYDAKGRASKSWLAVAGSSSPDYMDASSLQSTALGRDGVPYNETVYDALDRPVENWGVGEAWRTAGRRVQTIRRANTEGEVRKYTVNAAGHLTSSGYHPAGTLSVEVTIDEDNRTLSVYKNVAGLTLLERRSTDNNTYFIYNDLDQLQYVLSPMASAALASGTWSIANNQTLRNYAYYYEYDTRGRCVKKKLPGCDAILCQYDKADRLVFSRDGNQQQNGTGTFYLYDNLGREVVRGICQAANFPNTANLLARATLQSGGTYAGYSTALSLPPLVQLLVVNYYDTYAQMPDSASLPFVSQSEYTATKGDAHGLLTGKRVYQLGSAATYFPAVYFYDAKGQVVLLRTKNFRSGIDDTFTKYSFTGKPVKMLVNHRSGTQLKHTEEYAYTYDGVDRIKKVMHAVDGCNPVKIAEYTYNYLGLVGLKSNAGTSTSYTYNLRNWVTDIESPSFSEYLYYENVSGGTPQYGGNISSVEWYADGSVGGSQRGYHFTYDDLSRMVSSSYFSDYGDEDFDEHYGYDANGNINDLYRAGLSYDGTYNRIDDVTYYYNGNQLEQVYENADDPDTYGLFHFYDGCLDDGDEFQYDCNGNMTKDRNRGISSIDYNVLNLPQSIHYNDYSSISNTYTAEGEKLFRLSLINNNGWPTPIGNLTPPNITAYVTQYCGNMVYNFQSGQQTSELLLIDGGYVTFDGTTPKYHFYVQDHLGNNRAVVSQTGVVEQQAQYYPSGAIMTSISEGISQQPYLYSGKELDRMHALDWYDFGARHYDAALLRWHSMDPLCEKYYELSPYSYCKNRPINCIDPNGEDVAVLFESDGAHGFGHIAILIQGDYQKWYLYSKNGTADHSISGESYNDDEGIIWFDSPQSFLNDDYNLVRDEKSGETHRQYDEAYVIKTEKNKEAAEGALSEINKGYYNVIGSNCAETVQKALEGAGLDAGRIPEWEIKVVNSLPRGIGIIATLCIDKVPNWIYKRIKNNNDGITVKSEKKER